MGETGYEVVWPQGKKAGGTGYLVSKKIQLPANWSELIIEEGREEVRNGSIPTRRLRWYRKR